MPMLVSNALMLKKQSMKTSLNKESVLTLSEDIKIPPARNIEDTLQCWNLGDPSRGLHRLLRNLTSEEHSGDRNLTSRISFHNVIIKEYEHLRSLSGELNEEKFQQTCECMLFNDDKQKIGLLFLSRFTPWTGETSDTSLQNPNNPGFHQ